MLSKKENALITQTGPGTPMGELFRRYWIPALLSEEIPGPDCPPVRVRLLGEDLVAFRDSDGRVGLLGEYCAHRRASLFYGRNEECGLRCIYHGWKYDVAGRVLETPAEPPDSRIKDRVRHTSYPCVEASGVVFTYMGPKEKQPIFPNYEWLMVPPEHVGVTKFRLECNYLQALEGDCDTSHTAYLHRGNNGEGIGAPTESPPRFEMEQTWCGLRSAAIRTAGDRSYVRVSTFAMPFIGNVARGPMSEGKLDGYLAVYQVPSDDESTWRYNFRFNRKAPIEPGADLISHDRIQVGTDFRLTANRGNEYLLDRERQRTRNYTGVDGFATQDACVTESMGPITDRTQEHLGATDTYVIALRMFLLKAAKDFQRGAEPPGVIYDAARNDYSTATCTWVTVPPNGNWREVEEKVYGRS
jgi:phenylpropionate dioxygenase-like ring-hydroxylating dioxygenase large terminal subunit